jgi:hypothetical protein
MARQESGIRHAIEPERQAFVPQVGDEPMNTFFQTNKGALIAAAILLVVVLAVVLLVASGGGSGGGGGGY